MPPVLKHLLRVRIYPAVTSTEDELPLYFQMQKDWTVHSPTASTLFTISIGTNDDNLVDTTACVVGWACKLDDKVGAPNFLLIYVGHYSVRSEGHCRMSCPMRISVRSLVPTMAYDRG